MSKPEDFFKKTRKFILSRKKIAIGSYLLILLVILVALAVNREQANILNPTINNTAIARYCTSGDLSTSCNPTSNLYSVVTSSNTTLTQISSVSPTPLISPSPSQIFSPSPLPTVSLISSPSPAAPTPSPVVSPSPETSKSPSPTPLSSPSPKSSPTLSPTPTPIILAGKACFSLVLERPRSNLRVRIEARRSDNSVVAVIRVPFVSTGVSITENSFITKLGSAVRYHIKPDDHLARVVSGNPLTGCIIAQDRFLFGDVRGTYGKGDTSVIGDNRIGNNDLETIKRNYSTTDYQMALKNKNLVGAR